MIKYAYLFLSIIGIMIPYYFGFLIVRDTGTFNISRFLQEAVNNNSSAFLAGDLTVAALTALVFIIYEGITKGIKRWWLAVVGIFLIGTSFGLPFFLFLKELDKEGPHGVSKSTAKQSI